MLEFVDSGLYFVQDENNFITPLLQVGSGSNEKSTGSGGPKINGSARIWILIPGLRNGCSENFIRSHIIIFLFRTYQALVKAGRMEKEARHYLSSTRHYRGVWTLGRGYCTGKWFTPASYFQNMHGIFCQHHNLKQRIFRRLYMSLVCLVFIV